MGEKRIPLSVWSPHEAGATVSKVSQLYASFARLRNKAAPQCPNVQVWHLVEILEDDERLARALGKDACAELFDRNGWVCRQDVEHPPALFLGEKRGLVGRSRLPHTASTDEQDAQSGFRIAQPPEEVFGVMNRIGGRSTKRQGLVAEKTPKATQPSPILIQ